MAVLTGCSSCIAQCVSCNSCMTCLTCQGCDTCQACVACESCDTCQGTCDTSQAFCFTTGEYYGDYGSFSFSYQPIKDNIMGPGYFDQSVWDEIISYINRMLTKGKVPSGSAMPMSAKADIAPFKASEFNRIANAAGSTRVNPNDIIYGTYFQNLEKAVIKQQLSSTACDDCNTGCNVQCDKCLSCNSGVTDECGSGQACAQFNPIIGCADIAYCCSCNICEGCVTDNVPSEEE